MEYTENPEDLAEWMPLVVSNRDPMQKVAATRIKHGSDVDFGSLTRSMVKWLETQPNFELMLSCPVHYIDQRDNSRWKVRVKNQKTGELTKLEAGFVFLGAGGGALPLLQKSGIDEARGYGGFPVSGQWLVCQKPDVSGAGNVQVQTETAAAEDTIALGGVSLRYSDSPPGSCHGIDPLNFPLSAVEQVVAPLFFVERQNPNQKNLAQIGVVESGIIQSGVW